MSKTVRGIALGLALVATSQVAHAQEDTAADRADARLARQDRLLAEPTELMVRDGQLPPPFTLTLALPVAYNDNIDNADSGGRNDLHTNPSAVIDYLQQSGTVRIFGRLAADIDEYFDHEENGASTLVGRIGARIVDAKLGGFTPYAHYTPALIFGRHFEDHQLTVHTFAVGVGGKFPMGNVVLRPDFQIARREATNAAAERNQFGGSITLLGEFIPDKLSWSLAQAIQARHYTGGANSGRDDVNFLTSAGLSLALNALFSLELNATYERNASGTSGKDYSAFDIGPSIVFSVPFGSSPRAATANGGR